MKNNINILIIALIAIACNPHYEEQFSIQGEIFGSTEGEMICLSYPIKRDGIWYEQCDTTYIDSGHFRFDGCIDGVVPAELSFQNMDCVQLFIEPSEIKFSAERGALYDYSISGLTIDNELNEYRSEFAGYNKASYLKNYETMRKNEQWLAANNAGAPNTNELWAEFYKLILEHHSISDRWPDMAIKYIDTHPNQTITPFVIDKLIRFNYDTTIIETFISTLTEKQKNSHLGELMQIRYDIAKLNGGDIGSKVLDFTLLSTDSKQIKLSEYLPKGYILLDFWASWCAPCINEIPKVRELHKECGDKLQILSISVDKDKIDWQNAIEKLNLTDWPQLIENYTVDREKYYFAEQADMSLAYRVEQIPCFILIDKNGTITGRWPHLTPDAIKEIKQRVLE